MKNILKRIKEVTAGQSVNSIATAIQMPQTSLNAYMTGRHKITIELIKQISANYQVSADWLLGLTDDRGGVAPCTAKPSQLSPDKKVAELEAENAALKGEIRGLKGEIRGLQFALDSALKGAQPAQDSVSHSRLA